MSSRRNSVYIAIIMILVTALALCVNAVSYAQSSVTLKIESKTAEIGSQTQVNVIISNNSNIAALEAWIEYDDELLTLTDATLGSALSSVSGGQFYKNTDTAGKVFFQWDSTTSVLTTSGCVLTLTFDEKQEIEGTAAISFDNSESIYLYDGEYNQVPCVPINGKIEFKDSAEESYQINYELNGGENSSDNPQSYVSSQTITLKNPTRAGYQFAGWFYDAFFKQKASAPEIPLNMTGDLSVYAKWTPIKYTVTFDGNGSTSGRLLPAKKTVEDGDFTVVNTFIKTGYSLNCWNTCADGSGVDYSVLNMNTLLSLANSKNIITLYAQWTPNQYSVVFDSNGGTGTMGNESFIYDIYQNLTENAYTREGYTFTGWKLGLKNYSDGQMVSNLTSVSGGEAVLKAQWKPNTYTVVFDKNADSATGLMTDMQLTYDSGAKLKNNAFKKQNSVFAGWAETADAQEATYFDGDTVNNLATSGTVTLYAVWKDVKASGISLQDVYGESVSNSKETVDMHTNPQYQLSAVILPDNASKLVQWKSSSPAVATVDSNGLVTFVKPGIAKITATTTDGSKKSSMVTLNTYYMQTASKFTVSSTVPAIGLQVNETASISIYGDDKSTPMNAGLFTYEIVTKNGDQSLKLNKNGTFTALEPNKTITIKATLTGDPLNRSVTLNVKTIPVQTGSVYVIPSDGETQFVGVDANGDLSSESGLDAVSYALYLDTIQKGQPNQTFQVTVNAKDSKGNIIENLTGNSFKWASTSASVATVASNKNGEVYITVKAGAAGACSITATSNDLAKAQGSIAVYVKDYSPRLDVQTVVLDSQKENLAVVNLVASYGNKIANKSSIEIYEYNNKTKKYDTLSELLTVDSYDSDTGKLVVKANECVSNKTLKTQLMVTCQDGKTYALPLTVNIKNVSPSITISQTKFNLFYKDSTSLMTISAKNEEINGISIISDYFELDTEDDDLPFGTLKLKYAEGLFDNPFSLLNINTTVKVYLSLDGYENPVVKDVKLSTEIKKPTVKLSAASGTFNTNAANKSTSLSAVISDGTVLTDDTVYTTSDFIDVSNAGNSLTVELQEVNGAYKSGNSSIYVQGDNWTMPISCNYKVSVATKNPVVKLIKATLSLNSLADFTDSTSLTADQANFNAMDIADCVLEITGNNAEAEKIDVSLVNGEIFASINDATVKPGTYKYSFVPDYNGTSLSKLSVSVKVENKLPTAKLAKSTISISGFFENSEAKTALSLSDSRFTISDIGYYYATGKNADEAMENVALSYDSETGDIVATFTGEYQKTASYTFCIPVLLMDGNDLTTQKEAMLTVKLVDDRPTVSFDAKTLKLNTQFAGKEFAQAYALPLDTETEDAYDLGLYLTGPSGSKIITYCFFEEEYSRCADFSLDAENLPKAGSYKYTITPFLYEAYDSQSESYTGYIKLKSVPLTVQVYNSASISTTVAMNGKFDAIQRDNFVTLTFTKFDSLEGHLIDDFELVGPDADKFELVTFTDDSENTYVSQWYNAKGQLCIGIKLKDDTEVSAKTTYKVQVKVKVLSAESTDTVTETYDVYSNVLSFKVTQGSMKLGISPASQVLYQSQSRSRWLTYTISITNLPYATIKEIKLGNVGLFQKAFVNVEDNISWTINGNQATVKVLVKDTSQLATGKTYTIPLEVKASGCMSDSAATKVNLTLKVQK